MEYKMERDRHFLENTKLSLLNQSNVVEAIINLVDAIKAISAPEPRQTEVHSADVNTRGTTGRTCAPMSTTRVLLTAQAAVNDCYSVPATRATEVFFFFFFFFFSLSFFSYLLSSYLVLFLHCTSENAERS
jgi:hypothetical protein